MTKLMVSYRIELIDGSVFRGTVAVPATSSDGACRAVVGLIRGMHDNKYSRTDCFNDFDPHDVDDISVTCLGPA